METTVVFDGTQPKGDVGHFWYDATTDSWSWTAGLYAIHGYEPGEIPATTDVLLHHKHPDDRDRAAAVLDNVLRDGGVFSCYHRVINQRKQVRSVLSVGRAIVDDAGNVVGVDGYFVDLTAARRDETEAEVQQALAGIAEHRPVIDQAIGMVVATTGCTNEEAFARLREASHHSNLKVHAVAARLVDAVVSTGGAAPSTTLMLEAIVSEARADVRGSRASTDAAR